MPHATPEAERAYRRRVYDPVKQAEYDRRAYLANGDRERDWQRQWRADNPRLVAAQSRRRRERIRQADQSDAPTPEWENVLYADPCVYCFGPAAVLDHIDPLVMGGSGNVENFAPACGRCNARKGTRSLLRFLVAR